jgi:hypothetical protein
MDALCFEKKNLVQREDDMKRIRFTYWITTALFVLMMATSGILYLVKDEFVAGFIHLGFPQYFRVELAIFKLLGAAVLILPLAASTLKEWVYSGFFITLISAFIAHLESGDGPNKYLAPVACGFVLIGSYVCYRKIASKNME